MMGERVMSVDEIIAELKKPPGESSLNREELLEQLEAISMFSGRSARQAKNFLSGRVPAPLSKERLVQLLKGKISE